MVHPNLVPKRLKRKLAPANRYRLVKFDSAFPPADICAIQNNPLLESSVDDG